MNTSDSSFLFSTLHFAPRENLQARFADRARELLSRDTHFVRVRLTIARETRKYSHPYFAACVRLECAGPDIVFHAQAGEPDVAGEIALGTLEHIVNENHRRRMHERRHPQAAECGENLAKAVHQY